MEDILKFLQNLEVHLRNPPKKCKTYFRKVCEKCEES